MNINNDIEVKIYNDKDNTLEDVEVSKEIDKIFNERLKKNLELIKEKID